MNIIRKNALILQQGMSLFIIWAYHSSGDVEAAAFPQHMNTKRGVMRQTLIPAPTPGKIVKASKVRTDVKLRGTRKNLRFFDLF